MDTTSPAGVGRVLPEPVRRHLVVRCRSAGLSAARDLVGRCCRLAGLRDEAEQVAVLLASEVVTNAVVHAETDARLSVLLADHRVRVEVADGSPRRPLVRAWTDDGGTGRGMALVEALASRWGVDPSPSGKIVWFDVVDPAPCPTAGRGSVTPR
ncbi:ATP-binding protein [Pseudokineococcus basanitobsidens]|uniref:ATP-binding protein n=1 Tax=Pseudokineococcus basanitobsidens TaxID=1926649 RepID=A0ABU8RGS7_9ACTN